MRTCPLCKKGKWRPWSGTVRLKDLDVPARGDECSHCGEVFFSYEEVGRHEEFMAKTYIARGIRNGDEFTYIRKLMQLKALDLAHILGVTPETVSRWEGDVIPIPRLVAFTLGELYLHPKATRAKLAVYDSAASSPSSPSPKSPRRKTGQPRRAQ